MSKENKPRWYKDEKGEKHLLTDISLSALGGLKGSGLTPTEAPTEKEAEAVAVVNQNTANNTGEGTGANQTENVPPKVTRRRGPNKPKDTAPEEVKSNGPDKPNGEENASGQDADNLPFDPTEPQNENESNLNPNETGEPQGDAVTLEELKNTKQA